MARDRGIADEQIAAVIGGDRKVMGDDAALGYDLARAIAARVPESEDLREKVRTNWGDKGVLELTLAAQFSRTYPMLRAGLGEELRHEGIEFLGHTEDVCH